MAAPTDAGDQASISLDANGGFVVAGKPTFLIALSNPPPLSSRTPAGVPGPIEVARTGVNLVRVGPAWTGWWTRAAFGHLLGWERTAALLGIHVWVRLNAFAATQPHWQGDARLAAIVHALTRSRFAAAIGLWQGADEPWSRGIRPNKLAFVYCRLTSRGAPSACAGKPPLDDHLLVTVLAAGGTRAQLAPYRAVTDSLGVDVYPVTLRSYEAPNLHEVGIWTRTIGQIAPHHSVETTLQICSRRAYDKHTGAYVLPSAYQERYMVYDAIINGARALTFFGGNNPHCWNQTDRRYRWNWTFWNSDLDPLIEQISARSPLGPALADSASTKVMRTDDAGTEAITRIARTDSGTQLWLLAARDATGIRSVAISGLPASVTAAAVYGEHRRVQVVKGVIRDTFRQWQVHVYRIRLASSHQP